MKLLVGLFFAITFATSSFAQETKKEKLINVSSCNKENFWDCYKEKLALSISQNLTKGLLRESLINSTERDTVNLDFTFWLQKNGKISDGLFGSSFKRSTPEFNKLYWLVDATKLDVENLPKKVRIPRSGKQIFINIFFRKVKNKDGIIFLRPFKFKHEEFNEEYKNMIPPIYPGCENFSVMNEENFTKAKSCLQYNITKIVNSNYDISLLQDKIKFFTNKSVATLLKFKINKQGVIDNVKAISLVVFLENEAVRVIGKVPTIKPGLKDGKTIAINYSLPIMIKQAPTPFVNKTFNK